MFSFRKISPLGLRTIVRQFSADHAAHERSLNQVQLIGRSGNEPQKRGTETNPVIVFSLATSSSYKDENGAPTQKVEWHRICVFKPVLRDVVYNYLKKGHRLYVNGHLSYGEVHDEPTGRKIPLTSIIANDIIFFSN